MELRFYGFCNYYINQIGQGIQAKHAGDELENKYSIQFAANSDYAEDCNVQYNFLEEAGFLPAAKKLHNWRRNHKTVVLLNGGNSKDLQEIYDFISTQAHQHEIPFAKFHEDEQSLNGALTCVACVLPDRIYDARKKYPFGDQELLFLDVLKAAEYSNYEIELIQRITKLRLA